MTEPTLTDRVTILEQRVENLASLPARMAAVELQIRQLRDEMRGEFSAVRQELTTLFRSELLSNADSLRAEIREGDEETRRFMRVLHEDVIARIAALGNARR
jgi:hypothetical protein